MHELDPFYKTSASMSPTRQDKHLKPSQGNGTPEYRIRSRRPKSKSKERDSDPLRIKITKEPDKMRKGTPPLNQTRKRQEEMGNLGGIPVKFGKGGSPIKGMHEKISGAQRALLANSAIIDGSNASHVMAPFPKGNHAKYGSQMPSPTGKMANSPSRNTDRSRLEKKRTDPIERELRKTNEKLKSDLERLFHERRKIDKSLTVIENDVLEDIVLFAEAHGEELNGRLALELKKLLSLNPVAREQFSKKNEETESQEGPLSMRSQEGASNNQEAEFIE